MTHGILVDVDSALATEASTGAGVAMVEEVMARAAISIVGISCILVKARGIYCMCESGHWAGK
jgi:hypothetical protein